MKIIFGTLINNLDVFNHNLSKSVINDKIYFILNPESATSGLNKLISYGECDIFVAIHSDVIIPFGWESRLKSIIDNLPSNWGVLGVWGAYYDNGIFKFAGRVVDPRFRSKTSNGHIWAGEMPCEVMTLDEVCLVFNMKINFRFDETLTDFDLYGTYSCLKMKEDGYKSFAIDNALIHNTKRQMNWIPNDKFFSSFEWLKNRFPMYDVLSTVYDERFYMNKLKGDMMGIATKEKI